MVTPVAPLALVRGATRTPLPYGLFSVLTPRASGERWESGVVWEPGTCDPLDGIGQWNCLLDEGGPQIMQGAGAPRVAERGTIGFPKDLDSNLATDGEATPFTVYGHFQCSPVGYPGAAAQDMATAHLYTREEAMVESALWTGALGNLPALAIVGAIDVTGVAGTADTLPVGVGRLEDFLAVAYGSLGVIHMTRQAATIGLAEDVLTTSGARLFTKLGTPVVAGGGYPGTSPAGANPAAGQTWIYATPALFGYRSEVFTSSSRAGDTFDRATNDLFAIAERTYLLGFDPCGVGAVLVDLDEVLPEPPA